MRRSLATMSHHPVRIRGIFGGIDGDNGLLLKAQVGNHRFDHLWLQDTDADAVRSIPIGSEIRAWADVKQYRRKDRSHDYTICNLREVKVS